MSEKGMLRRLGKSSKKVSDFKITEAGETCKVEVIHECDCPFDTMIKKEVRRVLQIIKTRFVDEANRIYEVNVYDVKQILKTEINEWNNVYKVGVPKALIIKSLVSIATKPYYRIIDALDSGEMDFDKITNLGELIK